MYNRIRQSLIQPEALIDYRNDRFFKVLGYMLIFALFLSTASLIDVLTFESIEEPLRSVIDSDLNVQGIPCGIEAFTLTCDASVNQTIYTANNIQASVVSTLPSFDGYRGFTYYLLYAPEGVHLIFSGQEIEFFSYEQLPFEALDFETSPAATRAAFLNSLDRMILLWRPIWGPVVVIGRILGSLLIFNLFVIINAFILRLRLPMVPFKQMFAMFTYASTALFIVLIFDALVSLNFVFFILLLFIAFRQTSRLALEMQKRLIYNEVNPTEEAQDDDSETLDAWDGLEDDAASDEDTDKDA